MAVVFLILNYFRMLVGNRTESRPLEKVALFVLKPFQVLTPSFLHTPVEILAKAMIFNTIHDTNEKSEIIENNKIFELSKLYDQK